MVFDTSQIGEFKFKVTAQHKEIATLTGESLNIAHVKIICGIEEVYTTLNEWTIPV